ncbi:response regulator transcription factor [Albirhodobacter sp. R86504]|jgi:DNA-binding NarL/FixJ family response regulator|uniref:response regulator transcription factor n=1 Tax=Albirhodobacter sp. R86504 TaxID=3093848 RepID=UPI00366F02A0
MRVLIADDHELLRDTLTMFLQAQEGIEAVTTADLEEACAAIDTQPKFDLVLLDLNMPGMHGLDGLKRALALNGGQRVALLSGEATRDVVEQALELGAAGFVPKTLSAKSMVNAVKFMAMGEIYAPLDFMTAPDTTPVHPLAETLSTRELQMLEGLTEGKANKEIARDLDISEPTVKLHMKTLYRKLGAANRTQAALIAREAGLF